MGFHAQAVGPFRLIAQSLSKHPPSFLSAEEELDGLLRLGTNKRVDDHRVRSV